MKPETLQHKVSYLIGRDIAANFRKQGLEIDPDMLMTGLRAAMNGEASLLNPEESREAMSNFQREMAATQQAKQAGAASENKRAGATFLLENGRRPEVITLPSGLQYEVLSEGSGPRPTRADQVTTHYHGTLIDGTVFDSSYERGEPATFPVSGVISGWTQALQLMPIGSKWRLYIPSELAYGAQGAGEDIGPNAALIFDVELLKIN